MDSPAFLNLDAPGGESACLDVNPAQLGSMQGLPALRPLDRCSYLVTLAACAALTLLLGDPLVLCRASADSFPGSARSGRLEPGIPRCRP